MVIGNLQWLGKPSQNRLFAKYLSRFNTVLRARANPVTNDRADILRKSAPMTDPITPPDVLTMNRRAGWKPDPQGRLVFRTGLLGGGNYVVETGKQLNQIKSYERNKNILTVVVVGAAFGAFITMQPEDASVSAAVGSGVIVLVLVAVLIGYMLKGSRRIVADTAMRQAK